MNANDAGVSAAYPYQERDLLGQRDCYFYSQCAQKNYLDDYFEYRAEVIAKISSSCYPDPADYPHISSRRTNLCNILGKAEDLAKQGDTSLLDKFSAKFETRKKFYKTYTKKTLLPKKSDGDADSYCYIKFAQCLCAAYEEPSTLNYLSTLIKDNDLLCSLSFRYPETKELILVLESELRFVRDV